MSNEKDRLSQMLLDELNRMLRFESYPRKEIEVLITDMDNYGFVTY
mgnify:CR=1 FL=1